MKSVKASLMGLLACSMFGISLPASAQIKNIIGDPVRFCEGYAKTKGVPTPSAEWTTMCQQAARDQDACMRGTPGFIEGLPPPMGSGSKPNDATNACWRTLLSRITPVK